MLGRLAATVALVALAGCAGLQPAGRTAQRQAEAEASYPAPVTPPPSSTLPPPAPVQMQTPPPVAAQNVTVAAPTPPPSPPAHPRDPNEVTVTGTAPEQQVRPPNGDPRSVAERREDIRNWDHCVMQQLAQNSDPNQPTLETPEDVCSHQLGQASRNAVPASRLQHTP
jgi:hypothetical protein